MIPVEYPAEYLPWQFGGMQHNAPNALIINNVIDSNVCARQPHSYGHEHK
jgi:hypothetical protein